MKATEVCGCGGSVKASGHHVDVEATVTAWRVKHECDRRPAAEHTADALVEQTPRSAPAGFSVRP